MASRRKEKGASETPCVEEETVEMLMQKSAMVDEACVQTRCTMKFRKPERRAERWEAWLKFTANWTHDREQAWKLRHILHKVGNMSQRYHTIIFRGCFWTPVSGAKLKL